MNKLILGLVFAIALGCGVKGPPEPPLPTEGSLKKELQQEQAAPPQPVPPPAPVKKSKKTKAPKTQDQ